MSAIGDTLPYAGNFPSPDYVQYGDPFRAIAPFASAAADRGMPVMAIQAVITKGPAWHPAEVWASIDAGDAKTFTRLV